MTLTAARTQYTYRYITTLIPGTNGNKTLAQAGDVFQVGMDHKDIRRLDIPGESTDPCYISVRPVERSGNAVEVWTSIKNLDLLEFEQSQIVEFCRSNPDMLRIFYDQKTHFLSVAGEELFVATVCSTETILEVAASPFTEDVLIDKGDIVVVPLKYIK